MRDGAKVVLLDDKLRMQLLNALTEDNRLHVEVSVCGVTQSADHDVAFSGRDQGFAQAAQERPAGSHPGQWTTGCILERGRCDCKGRNELGDADNPGCCLLRLSAQSGDGGALHVSAAEAGMQRAVAGAGWAV